MGAKTTKLRTKGLSEERMCAEALMMACDERLGAQSPAALMVCDTFLARDFWTSFVHQSYLPPAASQMWAWGYNFFGQLGLGDTKDRATPTEVTSLHGRCIHSVACGPVHTMAVVDDGELWATGLNDRGQLGLGDIQKTSSFTHVSGLSGRKVAAVACGNSHALALLESGELFAWGWNSCGQLGLGDTFCRMTPEPVAALLGEDIVALACGSYHSVAGSNGGDLFSWGIAEQGQLGLGDNTNRYVPTQVTALAGQQVVAVDCGSLHTAAVAESGELFTWGCNEQGQLGHGDLTKSKNTPQLVEALRGRPVIAVACGDLHTLALLRNGDVFAWGRNIDVQQVLSLSHVRSIHSGFAHSAAILGSGTLFTNTSSNTLCFSPVVALSSIRVHSISFGNNFCVALVFMAN